MLAEVLHKVAAMEAKPEQDYKPRPSSAGPERCLRQMVLKANQLVGKKKGDRFVMVLDDSSLHEGLTANWIRKSTFTLQDQQLRLNCGTSVHLGAPFEVEGDIDGVIVDLIGTARLWEHKAINHFGFEKYLKGEYPLDYLTQCCLYIVGLRKRPEYKDLREALLLVKNKNTAAYLEFLLDFDPATDILTVKHLMGSDGTHMAGPIEFHGLYAGAFERFAEVEVHRVAGTLPGRQYDKSSDWQCDYCPFIDPCYEGYEREYHQEVKLDATALAKAEEYREVSDAMLTLKKRQDSLKKDLKVYLNTNGAFCAKANGMSVKISFQSKTSTDLKLIPPAILAAAQNEKTTEVIRITERSGVV